MTGVPIGPAPRAWPPPRSDEGIQAILRYCRQRDPIGHALHGTAAMAYLFLLPLWTTPKSIAWGVAALIALVRFTWVLWRCCLPLLRDRLVWLLVAWILVHVASLGWSLDPAQGRDELGTLHLMATPLILWPVLDLAPWLVASFLAGVFVQNGVQMAQGLGWWELSRWAGGERLHGALHPIQAGAVSAAAAAWHLALLLCLGRRRPWLSALGAVGFAAALAGLWASGSRGPWLAAAVSLPLVPCVFAARRPGRGRAALAAIAAGCVLAAAAWPIAGNYVAERTHSALTDIEATEHGHYGSDVGQRLARWEAAWKVVREHPWLGVGAGGYGIAAARLGYGELIPVDQHAHSTWLQELATVGLTGTAVVVAAMVLGLVRAARTRDDFAYALGTLAVLAGWLVGSLFDCYQLNGTMFGLLTFCLALVFPHRAAIETHDASHHHHDDQQDPRRRGPA